ncbi:UNVERIFIED_CONTAM: hypothetical protein GTU68_040266, partial [Idotea baltica]|nr:hypothetical protein [Idotea baltica]
AYSELTREELLKELEKKDTIIADFQCKVTPATECPSVPFEKDSPLDNDSIKRYSRQLILPEMGVAGQKRLRDSSVLIVGCGGLGCPAAIYLAAAGVGTLGLVDYDEVEISNLHRQILHTEGKVGMSKPHSIKQSVSSLNSKVKCKPHVLALSSQNIMEVVKEYDVVLDCTDNVATRYLLNDACIFSRKTLVSGSALRFDGQLTVYGVEDGPCYRCLFPNPPPPETVTNCSDGGVLGVVPGVIGCLQALEAMKIIIGMGEVCSKKLLLFDALSMSIRSVKLRGRQSSCELCGPNPSIKELIDYEMFCGGKATDKDTGLSLLNVNKRITVTKYKEMVDEGTPHILLDVRSPIEMEICKLPNTLNIPLRELDTEEARTKIRAASEQVGSSRIVCICRKGNDSQKAVAILDPNFEDDLITDVAGGLTAWANKIDYNFPVY